MATIDLTSENFVSTIESNELVFVDLWAAWCGPCQRFAPVYQAASEQNADVVFAKVDTEANQDLAGQLGVQGIPTIMIFKQGQLVFNQAGALPGAALDELIEAARSLDMSAAEDPEGE